MGRIPNDTCDKCGKVIKGNWNYDYWYIMKPREKDSSVIRNIICEGCRSDFLPG